MDNVWVNSRGHLWGEFSWTLRVNSPPTFQIGLFVNNPDGTDRILTVVWYLIYYGKNLGNLDSLPIQEN